jgi:signal transduction histidine kinase
VVPDPPPALADAAGLLSDRLRDQLHQLARLIHPHASSLQRRFRRWAAARGYGPQQIKALSEITPAAASTILAASRPLEDFFEQVDYSGRRLAKLNVPPASIAEALREFDRLLDPLLRDFKWAREQLHFCVVLAINNASYQVRESEIQAFYDIFQAERQAGNLDELLQSFAKTLRRTFRAQVGTIRFGQAGMPVPTGPRYIEGKGERYILDADWRGRYRSYWSIPLKSDGVIQLGFSIPYRWLPRELQLLNAVAERCLLAAEKARLIENLHSLSERMLHVEEEERRRIRRDLHDEAGQSLLFIRLQLEMMEKRAPPRLRTKLAETRGVVEHAIVELRRAIAALSPAVLEQLGLSAALRQLTSRFRKLAPVQVRLQIPARLCGLPRQSEVILYRLVQECYNNIAKHALASHVNLRLHSTDTSLELSVQDDGVGFDVEAALGKRNSYGLAGMRQRVALLGGTFQIHSRPHQGARIEIQLPIEQAQNYGQDSRVSYR